MTIPPLPDDPTVRQAHAAALERARTLPFFKLIGLEVEDLRLVGR